MLAKLARATLLLLALEFTTGVRLIKRRGDKTQSRGNKTLGSPLPSTLGPPYPINGRVPSTNSRGCSGALAAVNAARGNCPHLKEDQRLNDAAAEWVARETRTPLSHTSGSGSDKDKDNNVAMKNFGYTFMNNLNSCLSEARSGGQAMASFANNKSTGHYAALTNCDATDFGSACGTFSLFFVGGR